MDENNIFCNESGEIQDGANVIYDYSFWSRVSFALRRGIAVAIDYLVISLCVSLILGLFSFITGIFLTPTSNNMFANILILTYMVYYIFMLGKYGQTLGKKVLHIKLIRDNGEKASYIRLFFRFWLSIISGFVIMIGYLISIINPRRKTFHDFVVGTVVIPE